MGQTAPFPSGKLTNQSLVRPHLLVSAQASLFSSFFIHSTEQFSAVRITRRKPTAKKTSPTRQHTHLGFRPREVGERGGWADWRSLQWCQRFLKCSMNKIIRWRALDVYLQLLRRDINGSCRDLKGDWRTTLSLFLTHFLSLTLSVSGVYCLNYFLFLPSSLYLCLSNNSSVTLLLSLTHALPLSPSSPCPWTHGHFRESFPMIWIWVSLFFLFFCRTELSTFVGYDKKTGALSLNFQPWWLLLLDRTECRGRIYRPPWPRRKSFEPSTPRSRTEAPPCSLSLLPSFLPEQPSLSPPKIIPSSLL